ncbi:hypothetical protein [Actinoplanes sp. NPDC051494]|uniref:hypothetical protein n=1 Tax=Actinoplanes sp. NPDC051494 TaxID=3363907 RepID=UPI0037B66622
MSAPGPSEIFVPVRRRPPGAATTGRWRAAACDEVVRPAIRDALWEFVRGAVPLLHPGATAPAELALLSGLNDGRDADVKIGMLGTDTATVCLVLRARLGAPARDPAHPGAPASGRARSAQPTQGPAHPGAPGPGPAGAEGADQDRDYSGISAPGPGRPGRFAHPAGPTRDRDGLGRVLPIS